MLRKPPRFIFFFTLLAAGCASFAPSLNPAVYYDDTASLSPPALHDLGIIHWGGIETPRNLEKAKAYLLQASGEKYAPSLTALGDLVQKTAMVPKPYDDIVSYYQEAAALGDARAKFAMGRILSRILPDRPSKKTAMEWFMEADEGGYIPAAYEIGLMYEQKREYKKAHDYYLKASGGGNTEAKLALSDLYTFGRGVKQDKAKGLLFLKEAAQAGNPVAELNYGHALRKKAQYFDLISAGTWYAMAEAHGLKAAGDTLEIDRRTCLDNKANVKSRAISCPIAAATNDPAVFFALSALLRMDIPSPAHAREAHKWALASAKAGYEPARLIVEGDLKNNYGTDIDLGY